jgi:hypothetical protein
MDNKFPMNFISLFLHMYGNLLVILIVLIFFANVPTLLSSYTWLMQSP